MKKLVCSAALLLVAAIAGAQDTYTIKSNLKIEGMPAEYAAYGEQEIVTYVKGDKNKTEMTSMMGSNISYYDGKTMTALSDMMGNKTGYTATKEEMEGMEKKDKTESKPKIEYTTEKKTIAGYECTKALVTTLDREKKETIITVWITDKLKPSAPEARRSRRGGPDLGDLKGQPLAMEFSQSNNGMDMKIVMSATEVSTAALDDATFVPNTEGYKMMSYKEFMDKMKAMQGGR